jgi:methyl-accepting chemotaxis protein
MTSTPLPLPGAASLPADGQRPNAPSDPATRLFMNLPFTAKALLVTALLVLPLLALLGWQGWSQYGKDLAARQQAVQGHVEVAHQVLDWAHGLEKQGAVTRPQAQAMAKAAVSRLRYGQGEYFWINDFAPVMVMHPIKPELDGKDLGAFKDPNGVLVFRRFAEVARTQGGGFVDYQWPKPGADAPQDKVSYVEAFAPWGWVIGSGVYVDDVWADAQAAWTKLAIAAGATLLLAAYAFVGFYRAMRHGLDAGTS